MLPLDILEVIKLVVGPYCLDSGAISYITLTLSSILIIVHFILEVIKLLLL